MEYSLPPRQKQVLEFISTYSESQKYPPTQREIASHLGIKGTQAVIRHLEALEQKGLIKRDAGSSRGIVVTGKASSNGIPVPIVGTVHAGTLHDAIEHIDGSFSIDKSQVMSEGTFFLRVKGDSMIGASILDGDLALVAPQKAPANRSIVVAMINGEATLKRFFREKDQIRLQPENPDMQPIIVREENGEVSVIGKVVGIYRAVT